MPKEENAATPEDGNPKNQPTTQAMLSRLKPNDCLHATDGSLLVVASPSAPSLRNIFQEKIAFTPEQQSKVLLGLFQLLERVHQAGLLHRAITPEAIYLNKEGEVFLGAWEDSTLFNKNVVPSKYSAPEVIRKTTDQIDARSDLFSLGAVWYEWLTGQAPFLFESSFGLLKEIAAGPVAPKIRAPECPESFSIFCLSLLSAARESRPFSALAAAGYLEKSLASFNDKEPPIDPSPKPETSKDESHTKQREPDKKEPNQSAQIIQDLIIGREIGSYRVTGILGKGGMGVVYQAEHPGIGKKVAVKLLNAKYSDQQETVLRFFLEAKAVNQIHHENIIDVSDFGKLPSGECYIIMEFLDGKPLSSILKNKEQISLARLGHIILQVCSALAAAHQKGIIHRDLKPDNIFLINRSAKPDFVKLLDFGIAKLLDDDSVPIETGTGVLIGTPLYMSPEQALGKKIDHQTDIYALGILLYQLLTGEPPFYDTNPLTLAMKHITKEAKPPKERNTEIPQALNDLVMRCIAKEKSERYQTMVDVAKDLAAICGLDPAPYLALLSFVAQEPAPTQTSTISYQETLAPGESPKSAGGFSVSSDSAQTTPRTPTNETNPPREFPREKAQTPLALQETIGEVVPAPKRSVSAVLWLGVLGGLGLVIFILFSLGVIELAPKKTQERTPVSEKSQPSKAITTSAPIKDTASISLPTSSEAIPKEAPMKGPKTKKVEKPKEPKKVPCNIDDPDCSIED
jgi:serine/threonine protein kinase